MPRVKLSKISNNLVIDWQLSQIQIPVVEVIDVSFDDVYADKDKTAIRIGFPYGNTERIVIETTQSTYILFTSNEDSIKEKIRFLMNH
ncbi:hypothetical protein PP175_28565 (plasmid) [Aneurinibacillus sp. Ricciae_BoGa-3]|uniref:SunI/YnzG family protein n=1 Tax=Aneurinibacillus sp. Ricciae_BoGa-3 TaxID=3022697 RepID=UPI00233FAA78|nr:hypothetical protein [Aneurinibacillus sp. Ricciae_BoGa-3]WCK57145.1 hypothetical protein PP175_28565 [Aneurinibacillus sp. Ricciae_BoGa-3]